MKKGNSDHKTVGWIGTGVMGEAMATRIQGAGFRLVVHNRTKSKAEKLINRGATWADTPAGVAHISDFVFTIVGFPNDVEEVYFGENGIFKSIKAGSILVDMTTTRPSLALRIDQRARQYDSFAVDAPVSGGDVGAVNGTLSIMIGGEQEAIDAVIPLFEIMGKNLTIVGGPGSGQHTKMCNQITIAGTMIGVCESLLYAYKAGLDVNKVLQAIGGGAAGCWTLHNLAPRIVNNDFAPGFYVDHFVKDMEIALDESRSMNLSLPGLALVHQLYKAVQANDYGRNGTQALYLALAEISKVTRD